MNLVILFLSLTDVVVVNNDRIIDYSFLNLKGKEYSYSDITNIDTGFINKSFNLKGGSKGDFYYNVTFKNGETLEFVNVISN